MPKFRFAVRSAQGKLRTGTVTEATIEEARARLKGAGFVIVTLAEEAELVIHEAMADKAGSGGPRPERASIIEFEVSLSERIGNFFSTFVLRKEFALVLFLLGTLLAGYTFLNRPKPPESKAPKYIDCAVEIAVTGAKGGDTLVAMLPDIPLRFTQKVDPAAEPQIMTYGFETVKIPGTVEITLLDAQGEPIAEGQGLLSLKKPGFSTATVLLDPLKKKGP